MAGREVVKRAVQQVRPVLSVNKDEAKRRVLSLYKAWYRQAPYIVENFTIPRSADQVRAKIREEFSKQKDVDDIRVIDKLVIQGQMELVETLKHWKQGTHIMRYWRDTVESKPTDFLSKFIAGKN